MSSPLISIGGAQLLVRGLNPQHIGSQSEARVPGLPTWGGMDYQPTGMGEASTRIEALTYPHFVMRRGDPLVGLDALGVLQEIHASQKAVVYARMVGGAYLGRILGQVRVRHLTVDETNLHPVDGIGRRIGVELDLVFVGGP